MQLRSMERHGCLLPPVAPSPRTSARNATSSRSEVTWATFPDVTCSIRPTTRSEGRACASRCSTNARSGDSSSGAEFSAVRCADRGVFRVLATEATIRPPAITHDGTEVRLRLEGGKEAVRPRVDARRSTPDVRWLCPGLRQRAARVRRRGGRAHAEAVRGPAPPARGRRAAGHTRLMLREPPSNASSTACATNAMVRPPLCGGRTVVPAGVSALLHA